MTAKERRHLQNETWVISRLIAEHRYDEARDLLHQLYRWTEKK